MNQQYHSNQQQGNKNKPVIKNPKRLKVTTQSKSILKQQENDNNLLTSSQYFEQIRTALQKQPDQKLEGDLNVLYKMVINIRFFQEFEKKYGRQYTRNLVSQFKYGYYRQGQVIIQKGEYGQKIYILFQGKAGIQIPFSRQNSVFSPFSPHSGRKQSKQAMQIQRKTKLLSQMNLVQHDKQQQHSNNQQQIQKQSTQFNIPSDIIAPQVAQPLYEEVKEINVGECFGQILMNESDNKKTSQITAKCHCETVILHKEDYLAIINLAEGEETKQRVSFLQKLPFLMHWDYGNLKRLSYSIMIKNYIKNQIVYKEGEEYTDDLFIVHTGEFTMKKNIQTRIKVIPEYQESVTKVNYQEVKITALGLGEIFGEESFFDVHRRQHTVYASQLNCQVFYIKKQELQLRLSDDTSQLIFNQIINQKNQWRQERQIKLLEDIKDEYEAQLIIQSPKKTAEKESAETQQKAKIYSDKSQIQKKQILKCKEDNDQDDKDEENIQKDIIIVQKSKPKNKEEENKKEQDQKFQLGQLDNLTPQQMIECAPISFIIGFSNQNKVNDQQSVDQDTYITSANNNQFNLTGTKGQCNQQQKSKINRPQTVTQQSYQNRLQADIIQSNENYQMKFLTEQNILEGGKLQLKQYNGPSSITQNYFQNSGVQSTTNRKQKSLSVFQGINNCQNMLQFFHKKQDNNNVKKFVDNNCVPKTANANTRNKEFVLGSHKNSFGEEEQSQSELSKQISFTKMGQFEENIQPQQLSRKTSCSYHTAKPPPVPMNSDKKILTEYDSEDYQQQQFQYKTKKQLKKEQDEQTEFLRIMTSYGNRFKMTYKNVIEKNSKAAKKLEGEAAKLTIDKFNMIDHLNNQKSGKQLSDAQIKKQYFISQLRQNSSKKLMLTQPSTTNNSSKAVEGQLGNINIVTDSDDQFYNLKEYGKYAQSRIKKLKSLYLQTETDQDKESSYNFETCSNSLSKKHHSRTKSDIRANTHFFNTSIKEQSLQIKRSNKRSITEVTPSKIIGIDQSNIKMKLELQNRPSSNKNNNPEKQEDQSHNQRLKSQKVKIKEEASEFQDEQLKEQSQNPSQPVVILKTEEQTTTSSPHRSQNEIILSFKKLKQYQKIIRSQSEYQCQGNPQLQLFKNGSEQQKLIIDQKNNFLRNILLKKQARNGRSNSNNSNDLLTPRQQQHLSQYSVQSNSSNNNYCFNDLKQKFKSSISIHSQPGNNSQQKPVSYDVQFEKQKSFKIIKKFNYY